MTKPVSVIGIGLSLDDLTQRHLSIIKSADILVGGKRHLEMFKDSSAVKKTITKDIKGLIEYIRDNIKYSNVVVLASGDPMYYGIGPRLIKELGLENVVIYPNITTLAAAFSRIGESWHDVGCVSFHGRRQESDLFDALTQNDKIAVYTDPTCNPSWLASLLLGKGYTNFEMCVLAQLGTESEQVHWCTLSQAENMLFPEPNIVILNRIEETIAEAKLTLGTEDDLFIHQRGLITKSEIRALSLSKLNLETDHVLWDLGAGSGSVSIEASLFIKKGKIFSVEQHNDRVEQIKENKKRFKIKNLEVIQGVLPSGIEKLPKPDRIFIGGGGKNLKKIIESAAGHIKPGGIIVINTVLIANIDSAITTLKKTGFDTDMVHIQISRSKDMPWSVRMEPLSPVWIITGIKQ